MEELFFSTIISTTIQVVSSLSPFDCTAVLTICSAAGTGGSSREQLKATSGDKTSQTPSLAIMSRPPAVDSYTYYEAEYGLNAEDIDIMLNSYTY